VRAKVVGPQSNVIGHQMREQILLLSAEQVAESERPASPADIRHHGSQPGWVKLAYRR
jgi:hypothetical protein